LTGTTLSIIGDAQNDRISVVRDVATNQLIVTDFGNFLGAFSIGNVTQIAILLDGGNNFVSIAPNVPQPVQVLGGANNDRIFAFGSGNTVLMGGANGFDRLMGGMGVNTLFGSGGRTILSGGLGPALEIGGTGANVFRGDLLRDIAPFIN